MIFVTVGTQLPFERLARHIDDLATQIDEEIVGQIGKSAYKPKNFTYQASFSATEFDSIQQASRLIIAHAGIGSILGARRFAKPIIIVPRRAEFKEHRNNHQLATCKNLSGTEGVYVADSFDQLLAFATNKELKPITAAAANPKIDTFCKNLRQLMEN